MSTTVTYEVSTGARGPAGLTGPAGADGADGADGDTVDNAAVNAAIADDPAASRAALVLGTAALLDVENVVQPGEDVTFNSLDTDALTIESLPLASMLTNRVWVANPSDSWILTGGTSAATAFPTHFKMLSTTADSSTVIVRSAQSGDTFPMMLAGGGGNTLGLNKEVWCCFKFSIANASTTNAITRGWVGEVFSTYEFPTGATVRGFGFIVRNLKLRLAATGAGGTAVESAADLATLALNTTYVLIIKKAVDGTLTASLNGVALTSLAGGPTSDPPGGAICFSTTNGASAGAVATRVFVGPTLYYVTP